MRNSVLSQQTRNILKEAKIKSVGFLGQAVSICETKSQLNYMGFRLPLNSRQTPAVLKVQPRLSPQKARMLLFCLPPTGVFAQLCNLKVVDNTEHMY